MPTFQVPEDDSSLLSDTGSSMDIEGDSFIAQVNKINRVKAEEESKIREDAYAACIAASKRRVREHEQELAEKRNFFYYYKRPDKYDLKPKWPKERGTPPLFKQPERVAQPERVTPARVPQPERDFPMLNTDLPSSIGKRKRDQYELQPPARDTYPTSASDIDQDTHAPAVRRIGGMIVTILSCAAMFVASIFNYIRGQIGQDKEVLAVETDSSGRKRRAIPSSPSSASKKTRKISPATKKVRKISPTPGAFPSPIAAENSPVVLGPAALSDSKTSATSEQPRQVGFPPAVAVSSAVIAEDSRPAPSPPANATRSILSTDEEPHKLEPSIPGPSSSASITETSHAVHSLAVPVANTIPATKKKTRTISEALKASRAPITAEKNLKDEKVDGLIERSKRVSTTIESRRAAREEKRNNSYAKRDAERKRKEENAREYIHTLVQFSKAQKNVHDAEKRMAAWEEEQKRLAMRAEQRRQKDIENERLAQEAEEAERATAEKLAGQKAVEYERIAAEELARQKAIEDELARLAVEEDKKAKAEEEARVKAAEEAKLKAEDDARLKAEEEKAKTEAEEAARKIEEERLANDPVARAEAEEKARKDEEERLIAEATAQADYERKQILIRPLDSAWDDRVKEAMATKRETILATSPEGVSLSRRDFGTLLPQEGTSDDSSGWLNDEIINAMFQSIVFRKAEQTQRSKRHGGTVPAYESYNSSWYQTATSKKGVQGLDRWGRRKNISGDKLLQCEKVFMPINTGAHWTLIIVSPQEKTIEYLDSMNGKGINALKQTRAWLQMELGALYHPEEWTEMRGQSSKQANSDDCGVFTIMNGLAAAKRYPYSTVRSADMPVARRTIAAILLNKGFDGDWEL